MVSKKEVLVRSSALLAKLWVEYKDKGLLSAYLWGSITTPDFSSTKSDIDAIGILSVDADFAAFEKIREWLPKADTKLDNLHINFFFISELKGAKPSRSGLARLHDAEQAVYDFPHWIYVCGKRYTAKDFPEVTPEAALRHQIEVVKTRQVWAKNPEEYFSEMGKIYYCKGLVWLCYNIHQLSSKQGPFSWAELQRETNKDTESLTKILMKLKSDNWNYASINKALPNLYKLADELIKKYG